MKILILSPVVWNFFWQRFHEVAEGLSLKNDVIFVEPIVYQNPTTLRLKNIVNNKSSQRVKIVNRKTKLHRGVIFALYEDIKNAFLIIKYKPDAIITYQTANSLFLSLACKFSKTKLILDYVDEMSELMSNRLEAAMIKYFFNPIVAKLSHAIITSAYLLKRDMEKFNKNIFLIHNGIDINKFNINLTNKDYGRNNINVGFIGSFGHWVNFDIILKIAHRIKNVNFIFFGHGSEFGRVKKKAENIPNVTVNGRIDYKEVPKQIAKFDVGIIPFKINKLSNRVCPLKLFEYWALKKPVVCSPTYELKIIAKNKVKYAATERQWIKVLNDFSDSVSLRNKFGLRGYNEVINHYNYKVIIAKYQNVIDKVVRNIK